MSWLDWVFLALNALTYALGHYHGNNRGTATAADSIGAAVDILIAAQDAQAARAGTAAGAAAHTASEQAGAVRIAANKVASIVADTSGPPKAS